MSDPLVIVGLPQSTVKLLEKLARKTKTSMVEILAEALKDKAKKHLTPEELRSDS